MNEDFLLKILDELNSQFKGYSIKIVQNKNTGDINKFEIKLKNERGLDSYSLNISDEVFNDINNFYYTYKLKIVWNNTRDTFRLYDKNN